MMVDSVLKELGRAEAGLASRNRFSSKSSIFKLHPWFFSLESIQNLYRQPVMTSPHFIQQYFTSFCEDPVLKSLEKVGLGLYPYENELNISTQGDWRRRWRARGKAGLSCCQAVSQVKQGHSSLKLLQKSKQFLVVCNQQWLFNLLSKPDDVYCVFMFSLWLGQLFMAQERGVWCHSSTLWSRDIHKWTSQRWGLLILHSPHIVLPGEFWQL